MDQEENKEPHQNDSEKDVISDYYQGYQQLELESAETQVKKARNALFVVAGLTLVVNLIQLGGMDQLTIIPVAFVLLITAIFAGLGFLTKKQPFTAIIIGLVVYVGLWILDIAVLGAEEIGKGIIFKAAIVYFLIRGLKHARDAEKLRKEINK
jgi:hypothetical protein